MKGGHSGGMSSFPRDLLANPAPISGSFNEGSVYKAGTSLRPAAVVGEIGNFHHTRGRSRRQAAEEGGHHVRSHHMVLAAGEVDLRYRSQAVGDRYGIERSFQRRQGAWTNY